MWNELHAEQQATAAHVSDTFMVLEKVLQALSQASAQSLRSFDKLIALDDFQRDQGDRVLTIQAMTNS
jgi:hypothetical protein